MDIRQIRDIKVLLPSDDELVPADGPPARGDVSGLAVTDADWSRLQLDGRAVTGCHFTGVSLREAVLEQARLSNTTFDDCDFASARLTDTKIDRCVFTGCRLMGVNARRLTLIDVVFERCRFDYATLTELTATGPLAFVDCMLRETTIAESKLEGVVFADCPMPGTGIARTKLRGADLRGSQISGLAGATQLAGTTLDPAQIPQLTHALLAELHINIRP
ncbi:pentapeptide repeat-containing protein [Actinocorallia sp. A-T 12471]|uniref:pentapeptide repeat-containing protein n=1 Tax=Actinocorallia sp. A-T 12471 TaxID=3089813 RepID=UPI0029D25B9A|nr:pentapeptide repeat-containing protein [Actinocorallia sp. A-T 12471]MDX6744141.1 pentapeptide repeat-containing protein [Actinocorallia sp. A-T 12471]